MNFLSSFFTNPALLAGAAAGGIPIIIHLLNRQRFRRVWWAAMHWLWASYKKAHRRLQIEQLILLLIRVLILVLLALALARPALQAGMGLIAGRPSVYRIIVLDNSYSMGHVVGGRALYDKAKELSFQLVNELHDSDAVTVLLANSSAEELVHAEGNKRSDVIRDLRTAPLSDGTTHLGRGIAAACRLIREKRSKNVRREIIVVTDQTRAAWLQGDQARKLDANDEAVVQEVFQDERARPHLWIIRLDGGRSHENVAAERLEVDEKVVTAGVETQFAGSVRNFGTSPAKQVAVSLKVDGEPAGREELPLVEPGKSAQVTFRYTFHDPGSHALTLVIEPDELPVDNTAFLALDVEKEVKVLCVDGQQRIGPNESELDFFRQALSPTRAQEIGAGRMPLVPEVISDGAFPAVNLDEYRLVVLGNVALIPKEKVAGLEQFVRRGGALWIWLGDRIDPATYNHDLERLLPATVGEAVGLGQTDGPGEALSDRHLDHPALEHFHNIRTLPLGELRVYRHFKLTPRVLGPMATRDGYGPPRTVLSFEDDSPAAIEFRVGEGRVLLVGTTADKAWNNWPAKNHYMPLVNFLALDLIRPEYTLRNRLVGEPLVYHMAREELGPARVEGLRLRDPNNEPLQMDVAAETFTGTSRPTRRAGHYTLPVPGAGGRFVHFSANRNLEESDLDTLEDDRLRMLFADNPQAAPEGPGFALPAAVTRADVELVEPEQSQIEASLKRFASGREIWRWLAGIVLALLLLESLLAMRFGNYGR
jgi:hypothetical protein